MILKLMKKTSIQNYILNKNKNDEFTTRERFKKSLVAYSIISYLLGVGDRHMENIMLTDKGVLFHVDYGYVLGQDPKPAQPYMRITEIMIDAMGGKIEEFKELLIKSFMILRRYTSLFVNLLVFIAEATPAISSRVPIEEIENQIIMRFLPGQSDDDAQAILINRMEQSRSALAGWVGDQSHYILSNDNTQNITNSLSSTIAYFYSFYDSSTKKK